MSNNIIDMEITCIMCKKVYPKKLIVEEDVCKRCWEVHRINEYISMADVRIPNPLRDPYIEECKAHLFNPFWTK